MELLSLVVTSVLVLMFIYHFVYLKPKEKRLVKQGILPKPEVTTIGDIKRLKHDEKYSEWALLRLIQMPEYKDKPHDELKRILDNL